MDIKIIIGTIVTVSIIGGGVFFMTDIMSGRSETSPCADACRKAHETCPSLINESQCNTTCAGMSKETMAHLEESETCEQLTSRPDLIADSVIPEGATPAPVDKNAEQCEAACGSYVGKCLTLVPNATPALFEEGQSSCMAECVHWDINKIDCMVGAFDCESMTTVCGL